MLINNPVITGSFSVNGVSVLGITSSNDVSQSFVIVSQSYAATSASFVTVSSSYSASSGSMSTRVTKIEGNYATTGSNIFTGAQTVCANITSTGTIIAQTLNVQQVTSSVVYSSGSNIFGCSLVNTQQFTGSVTMTGSLNVFTAGTTPEFQVAVGGNTIGNALTDVHQVTGSLRITGSNALFNVGCVGIGTATPAAAPLTIKSSGATGILMACDSLNQAVSSRLFFESCFNQFAILNNAGNLSLQYGSSLVNTSGTAGLRMDGCGVVFSSCQVCAPAFVGGTVSGTSATFSGTVNAGGAIKTSGQNLVNEASVLKFSQESSTVSQIAAYGATTGTAGTLNIIMKSSDASVNNVALSFASTGAATFSSSVTAGGSILISTATNNYAYQNFGANSGYGWQIGKADNSAVIAPSNGFYIYDLTNSATRMVISQGGNVGMGASIAPTYKLEVSTAGGSERIRVGTLQNNNNTSTFEAITSAATTTASSGWLRANYLGGLSLGTSTYTKAGGDSGNFNCLSAEVSSSRLTIDGSGIACFACTVCAPNFITTGGCSSVRGGDSAFFRGSTVTQSGNSITFDAFRFLNPTGGLGGAASAISGRLYMTFQDTSTGGNQVSYQYLIFTTGNGVSPGPSCFVQLYCGPVRGVNPISAISLVNDGAGGAVKVQATTAASGVAGAVAYITFVGTAV